MYCVWATARKSAKLEKEKRLYLTGTCMDLSWNFTSFVELGITTEPSRHLLPFVAVELHPAYADSDLVFLQLEAIS
jgi:hypothetical protein